MHPSMRVMLAALKFFLGQDEREDEDSDDDEEPAPAAPSREDMYKAKHKVRHWGTNLTLCPVLLLQAMRGRAFCSAFRTLLLYTEFPRFDAPHRFASVITASVV